MQHTDNRSIAYFSMEIALQSDMPTYSGGLGVLAGDTLRSAADLELPMVAVSMLYRKGYFYQHIDEGGQQSEEPMKWAVDDFLEELPERVTVPIEGREVQVRAWKYDVKGQSGHTLPVFLLDTDLPENSDYDRTLSHHLYGGDERYRLGQEVVLGIGGVRMLHELGYGDGLECYHMNEGHAALLTLGLLNKTAHAAGRTTVTNEDAEAVRNQCVFTTHTPVPAGHDTFPLDLVRQVLPPSDDGELGYGVDLVEQALDLGVHKAERDAGVLNMTHLALGLSRYCNGVAKKHGEVSREMFNDPDVDAITNGVHVHTWVQPPFAKLFDEYLPGWSTDPYVLRNALTIPHRKVWAAHQQAKKDLAAMVQRRINVALDQDLFTIGFARRLAPYKRAHLFFSDHDRLRRIAREVGPFQIVMAGKAHPRDTQGKEILRTIYDARDALQDVIKVAYIPNYDMSVAATMIAGVDVWMNTPRPPKEASGTSGMKAAINGVPQLSTLDGWWLEGWIENVTGWSIGNMSNHLEADWHGDAGSIYGKLEHIILPLFYQHRTKYIDVMRHAIALNGSYFHTQRMVNEYVVRAYL